MTNFDKLTASPEALAPYLLHECEADIGGGCYAMYTRYPNGSESWGAIGDSDIKRVIDWLRQPVEGEGEDG